MGEQGVGWVVLELVNFLSRIPNLKKDFFGGGRRGEGGGELEEVNCFYKNPNLKINIYIFFFFGGGGWWGWGGGGEVGWGQWEARVNKYLLLSTRI